MPPASTAFIASPPSKESTNFPNATAARICGRTMKKLKTPMKNPILFPGITLASIA